MNASDATINILIVDDEPEFADTVAEILEREDGRFDSKKATNAEEGLEILDTHRIDCVVSDYGMVGTNGLEFLETVHDIHGEIPFVLLTGEGDEAVASEAISKGVTDYVRKRGDKDQYSLLASRLADAVEKRRAHVALRRRKQELEHLNERFYSFVRHSPDIITILEADGTIQYNSPAIEHILGYEQDEPVGEKAFEYVHPDDRERIEAEFDRLREIEDEARESFEMRLRRADGSWIWVESIASNRVEAGSNGFLMNSREISDRKAREGELEAKTERLDEFASIVSHDLQTPITVADARLEMAMEECDSEHLSSIGNALDRMEEIIGATLTLAREGRVVDETEPVALAAAAERWWETTGHDDATLRVEADGLTVAADRERLRRVMENLFANAVEHGGSDVTVRLGKLESAPGVYIADDGAGLPPNMSAEIFEPGQSMSPDGTGFGLAIVKEIVEAHDWEIETAESESGGARFEITGVEFV
ncbi:MAG: PAS domain S-box protein [Natronomonas sp.]|uniref:ATP-binding response regulator n=1 Tax=Natronomonas sp. TaxID=2184060 RepID=UPI00286FC1BB|nr:PAS domain S-box protein [Natronomonas sp.]MDR9380282.1 PAS domain S-box protein [Natronomonas sp.]MDR9429575.1 PAS domain S-box protein [Natronomonas sp.]